MLYNYMCLLTLDNHFAHWKPFCMKIRKMVVHWGTKENKRSMYPIDNHSAEWLSIRDIWTCLSNTWRCTLYTLSVHIQWVNCVCWTQWTPLYIFHILSFPMEVHGHNYFTKPPNLTLVGIE